MFLCVCVCVCVRYFASEPFADLHRVEGLRGVFIATLVNGSLSEDNMRSVITFDKGGTWELLPPPTSDSLGGTVDCKVTHTHTHSHTYTHTHTLPHTQSVSQSHRNSQTA